MDGESLAKLVFGLIGGLGIFLLGMKNMSDGMQAVAGSSLRRMIGLATNNRFLATGVGTLVTTLIQSSSITTVMVVGFVNSGVMSLQQAMGVIMGANIGTTITGWIIALKIGKYGLPILGAWAFVYLFSKGDRWRSWAMFFMGIGMVFFGLELMKDACKVIRETPDFQLWFQRFQADSYFGVIKCALAGCLLTMMVQSSSATLGITITLATEGVIGYQTAAALVLGENIGTTITAYLASLGATTNARRAAYFHVIFNLVGVFWITLIFGWYTALVLRIVPSGMEAQIATTHSIFNVVNTLAFLGFVAPIATLLERLVPAKAFKEKPRLTDLDIRMLETPMLAVEQSRQEIIKMGEDCHRMLLWLRELLQQESLNRSQVLELREKEKMLDDVQDEVSSFVTNLLAGNVPHNVAQECRQQLRLADEYESVSDYVTSIVRFDEKLRQGELRFAPKQVEGLVSLCDTIAGFVEEVNRAYCDGNLNVAEEVGSSSKKIRRQIKDLRKAYLEELPQETLVAPQITVAFLNALNGFGRVRDHAMVVAETISGER